MELKKITISSDKEIGFYVQESIGGWKQTPMYSGTYEECQKYVNDNNSNRSLSIVPEEELEVDYL